MDSSGATGDLTSPRFQIDAWATTQKSAKAIADAVRADAPPPLPLSQQGGVALLIGPEGGFTDEERRMLRGLSFVVPVSLGPRILRAETAVIAALSVIQSIWGDWRET